ncbi:hypothetical protein AWENTII_006853 [Aspergillus wentii]
MKFLTLAITAISLGTASAASIPRDPNEIFSRGECIPEGSYCCTWEGCKACCNDWFNFCDLSIDAAQGKCAWQYIE